MIVLAATPAARADGWASRAVVAVAGAWAGEGLRVFLMDLGLDAPSLHTALGLPNEEGVSDAFLYGASVQRIAQPALDEAFYFASAGSPTADPEEILDHTRWEDLAGGFSEVDATLLLFLPTGIPGAESILKRATEVLFLAAEEESPDTHLGPASVKVVSGFGPLVTPTETGLPTSPEGGTGEPGVGEPTEVGGGAPETVAGGEGEPLFADEESISLADGFGEPTGEGVLEEREVDLGEPPLSGEEEWEEPLEEAETVSVGGLAPEGSPEDPEAPQEDESFVAEPLEGLIVEGQEVSSFMGAGQEGVLRGAPEAPDFGAEFADLPSLEEEESSDEEDSFAEVPIPEGEGVAAAATGDQPEPGAGVDAPPRDEGATATSAEEPARSRPERDRPPRRPGPPSPRRRLPGPALIGVLALLLVALAAVGTATGIVNVPGFTFLQDMFGEVPYPALTLEGSAEPNEPVIRYSLEILTYEEGQVDFAVEMRDELRTQRPDLLFTLVPRDTEGVVSYALLAGPALSMIEVEILRGSLSEIVGGGRETPETWPVRETPRAFYLGERPTLAEAQDFLDGIEVDGISGYILHVTYPNGQEAFEVLAGAFEGVRDARPLQLMLRSEGFRDVPLIERRGRVPE